MNIARRYKIVAVVGVAVAVAATAPMLPRAIEAAGLLIHSDDAAAIVNWRLASIPATRIADAAKAALEDNDPKLAASLAQVADDHHVPLPPDLAERIRKAQGFDIHRAVEEWWKGFLHGDASTGPALAGAIASDLTGVGDVRDIAEQGSAWLAGKRPDFLTLGLAVAGLTITGTTVSSWGIDIPAVFPAREGFTMLKAMNKAGTLSRPLRDEMLKAAEASVDRAAIGKAVDAAKGGHLGMTRDAAEAAFRPAAFSAVAGAAGDLAAITSKFGYQAANDTIESARSVKDIRRLRMLSEHLGGSFRGVLKLLGASALTIGGILLSVTGWAMTGLVWLLAAGWVAFRIVWWVGVRLWRLVHPTRQAT